MAALTREQIIVGILLRVTPERWDAPRGTVARVMSVGQAGVPSVWCFTVEWLNRPFHYGQTRYSLNLFEEDLQDFDIYTGPIEQPPDRNARRRRAKIPQRPPNSSAYRTRVMNLFPTDQPTGTSISTLIRLGTSTWTYEGWQRSAFERERRGLFYA